MQDAKRSLRYFFGRFYFEKINKRYLAVLPCLYVDNQNRTFETSWIIWSFVIYFGNENK